MIWHFCCQAGVLRYKILQPDHYLGIQANVFQSDLYPVSIVCHTPIYCSSWLFLILPDFKLPLAAKNSNKSSRFILRLCIHTIFTFWHPKVVLTHQEGQLPVVCTLCAYCCSIQTKNGAHAFFARSFVVINYIPVSDSYINNQHRTSHIKHSECTQLLSNFQQTYAYSHWQQNRPDVRVHTFTSLPTLPLLPLLHKDMTSWSVTAVLYYDDVIITSHVV